IVLHTNFVGNTPVRPVRTQRLRRVVLIRFSDQYADKRISMERRARRRLYWSTKFHVYPPRPFRIRLDDVESRYCSCIDGTNSCLCDSLKMVVPVLPEKFTEVCSAFG